MSLVVAKYINKNESNFRGKSYCLRTRFLLTDILIKQLKLSQLPKSKMVHKPVTDLNGKDIFESFVRCMLYFNIITFQNLNNKIFS